MASKEKFWWIKIKTDFFDDDSPIDTLLSFPNGSEYVCLYLKLCLQTANRRGRLCNEIGEILIPYDIEKIQRDMKHFSIDTVRVAMELYQKLGLIYEEADGVLTIAYHTEMVGSESASKDAIRKRRQRARIEQNKNSVTYSGTENGTESGTNCPTEYRDKSIDIRDKEIRDKKNNKAAKPPVVYFPNDEKLNQAFIDYFDMRKKIKAPMTDKAVELAIKKLDKLSAGDNDVAIEILNQSILNSWKGLFELKEKAASKPRDIFDELRDC